MHGMNEKWKREVSVFLSFTLHTFENNTHNIKYIALKTEIKERSKKKITHETEIMHFTVEWDTNESSEYTDIVWIYVYIL